MNATIFDILRSATKVQWNGCYF